MAPLRSLGNPDISPFDDVFAATGKRYNHEYEEPANYQGAGAATRGY